VLQGGLRVFGKTKFDIWAGVFDQLDNADLQCRLAAKAIQA